MDSLISRAGLFGEFSGQGGSVELEYLLTGEVGGRETLLELGGGQSALGVGADDGGGVLGEIGGVQRQIHD